jgi:phosphate transport system substrate-binding protein
LYLYVKKSSARRPEVKAFLSFYLENVADLSRKGGYDPPSPAEISANKEALARLVGGSTTASAKPAEPPAAEK